jgi:hypothetical protein
MMSMADFERQMAEEASRDSARVGSGADGSFISIKGGRMTYQESDLGQDLEVVIIDFVNERAYYDDDYDPENPSSPACWAITHDDPGEMQPNKDVPVQQAEKCKGCWADEFGTADRGRGKACKEMRKLMLVAAEDFNSDTPDKEVALMRVPPSSIKNFDKHVKGLEKLSKRPCYGAVTNIHVDMIDSQYPGVSFTPESLINDAGTLSEVMNIRTVHGDELMESYDPEGYRPPSPKGRGKAAAPKKKAAGTRQFKK